MLAPHQEILVVEESVYDQTPCCCYYCVPHGSKVYYVKDPSSNTLVMRGVEELDNCCRKCGCLCRRDFDIKLEDPNGREVYRMTHDRMCCTAFKWCACCRHEFRAYRGDVLLGTASEDCKCWCTCFPTFTVRDSKEQVVYDISKDLNCFQACCGQACNCCCCSCKFPLGYSINGKKDSEEGSVQKVADKREEDSFIVKFPPSATEELRVLLVSASFLVDYALYDEPKKESMD